MSGFTYLDPPGFEQATNSEHCEGHAGAFGKK
jgi:hypothetical protein